MNTNIAIAPSTLLRLGAGALGLAAVGVLLVQGSEAAFTASTTNTANVVTSGTVALSDSDGSGVDGKGAGTAMFNVGNLNGGQTVTRCINVSYGGSLTADIKLFGTSGGALAPGLTTTIEVGTGTEATGGANFSCAGFTTASTLFTGSLTHFGATHQAYGSGLQGQTDATAGSTKTYKITMVVSNDNAYQGKTADAAFTWEAQGKDVATGNKVNGVNSDDVNKAL